MRVLHLIETLEPGGIEKWLLSLLEELDRSVCAVDFACKGAGVGSLAAEARQHGAQVLHCPMMPDHLRYVRAVTRMLEEGNYDLVHNHLGAYTGVGAYVARKAGLPVVTSYHNTHHKAQTRWMRRPGIRQLRSLYAKLSIGYARRNSDTITGCSRAVLDAFAAPPVPAHVLFYGTRLPAPATEDERLALRREIGLPGDAALMLHVGKFKRQKNHHGVLELFGLVRADHPPARLVLVGDGPLREEIEQEVARRGLGDGVRFLGARDDVPLLMARSDVFILPSFFEGFGLVALEASAAGIPVVASRVPGLEEAVADGSSGYLFPPQEIGQMARAVLGFLQDPESARQVGAAGRKRVETEFSTGASAQRLLGIYDECLGRRRHASSRHS